MNVDQDLEHLMGTLGDFGRYQFWQYFLLILASLTSGIHMISLVTVAAVPDHRCFIPGVDTQLVSAGWNSSGITAAIPLNKAGALDSCLMYDGKNITVKCSQWVYDTEYYKSSRAMDWDLVCDRKWMGAVAQTVYMLGVFFGASTLGRLSDKIGRKKVFCLSTFMQLVLGVGVAYVDNYVLFLVVRFFYGSFGSAGAYLAGFILTMELVGPSYRTICGIAFQGAFALGTMILAGWASIIHDRQTLQMVYGMHALIFLGHWWLIDESPRWLWSQGRAKEAVEVVQKGLRVNGSSIKLDTAHYVSKGSLLARKDKVINAGILDLFKTSNLRKKTLNICLCLFANSMVYYGLSLSTGKLQGNPFLMLFLMGLVELPCFVLVILLMDRVGRRALISSLMITGGVCCIVATQVDPNSTAATVVVMMGKMFIAGSFAIVYNYAAELFPTVVRNSALGMGATCAKVSGLLTPLITLLDSFDQAIPALIFGVAALISGMLTLFLPETNGQPLPQTLLDGETFGSGDTCFTNCIRGRRSSRNHIQINGKFV